MNATAYTWIQGALVLDADTLAAIATAPEASRLSLAILLAAGISNALGQSVALFANRVRPWRFAASLITGALTFALSVLVWGAAVDLTTRVVLQHDVSLWAVLRVVGLAHVPRLFSFFTFTPYFGSGIGILLTLWTYLVLTVAVRSAFGLSQMDALIAMGAAWVLTELISRTVGRPAAAALRWLRSQRFPAPTDASAS